jgi:hypothetical protein
MVQGYHILFEIWIVSCWDVNKRKEIIENEIKFLCIDLWNFV